ncbi:MAG: 2Fe-2S iron-sulfur cluster-binding protein [Mycobacterium sp.]
MTKVTFVTRGSAEISVDVAPGVSVMQAATDNGIRDILADCGGQRQCATCHVHVRVPDVTLLPIMTEDEDEMLDITACERDADSRLSCQIIASDDLDELVLELPERQR